MTTISEWDPPAILIERAKAISEKHCISLDEAWVRIQNAFLENAERCLSWLYESEPDNKKDIAMWERVRDVAQHRIQTRPWLNQ